MDRPDKASPPPRPGDAAPSPPKTVSAPAGEAPSTGGGSGPSWRVAAYLLALVTLAGWALFDRLGAAHLRGDEALWAVLAEGMTRENFWIGELVPGAGPADKPPLYTWLTAATRALFTDPELPYRAWAALAGVAVILATYRLGSLLFRAETGLLAGALLLANAGFTFHPSHGPRSGVGDSLLVLFLLLAAIAAWHARSGRRRLLHWLGVGLACGGASMIKPLLGFPALGLLAVHHLIYRRPGTRYRELLYGPLVAGLTALLVILPWNLSMWLRYGDWFLDKQYVWNLWERAVTGIPKHVEGPLYYWLDVTLSSPTFWLFVPAMAASAWWSLRGRDRAPHGLLVIAAIGWIGLFSLSASKRDWYVFPAYPLIAVAIAALVDRLVHLRPAGRFPLRRAVPRPVVAGLALALATGGTLVNVRREIPERLRIRYVPWAAYEATRALAEPRPPFYLLGFPHDRQHAFDDLDRLPDPSYHYYLPKMTEAVRLRGFVAAKPILRRAAHLGEPLVMVLGAPATSPLANRVDRWMENLEARRVMRSYCVAYVRSVPEVRVRLGAERPPHWRPWVPPPPD